jgi:hypothetical protein
LLLLIALLFDFGLRWLFADDDDEADAFGVFRVDVPSLLGNRRRSHVCRSAFFCVNQ